MKATLIAHTAGNPYKCQKEHSRPRYCRTKNVPNVTFTGFFFSIFFK